MPSFRRLLLLLWVSLLPTLRLLAQPPVTVSDEVVQVSLRGHLTYLRDPTAQLTLADLGRPAVASAFQPVLTPVPNFGYTSQANAGGPVWLRFRVQNRANQPQKWLAELNFWCFDAVQVAVTDARNHVLSVSPVASWRKPVEERLRHHRYYWFPVRVPAGQTVTVYLRAFKERGTQIVPVELIRESAYEPATQRGYLFWGGILFTLAFVMVMSVFFYLTTLDLIYLKYAFCVLGLVGFFAINDGFLYQFGFNAQFWMPGQNVYFLFPLVLFHSQLIFIRSFLPLCYTPSRSWYHVSTGVLAGGGLCLVALFVEHIVPLPPVVMSGLMRFFTLFYWLPMLVIGAYIVIGIMQRYHVRAAWVYLLAVAPFYALNLGQVLANFGLIPTYPIVANYQYYALAALFEALVLTFGLAYRYKLDRDRTLMLLKEQTHQQQRTYEAEVQTLAFKNGLLIEKERIARDLHDNVGAHLAFVVTNLTHISSQAETQPIANGRQWAGQLRNIVTHTREAIKLLRETIWAIHQENFTVEEFTERLNQYINRYFHETDGLHVDFLVTGSQSQRLGSAQVLNLFRIVQEALGNVVKHAHATQATVTLHVSAQDRIRLRIHDNGRGFDWPAGASAEPHYGLQNMKTRAEELGGTFRVTAGEGTTVEVEV